MVKWLMEILKKISPWGRLNLTGNAWGTILGSSLYNHRKSKGSPMNMKNSGYCIVIAQSIGLGDLKNYEICGASGLPGDMDETAKKLLDVVDGLLGEMGITKGYVREKEAREIYRDLDMRIKKAGASGRAIDRSVPMGLVVDEGKKYWMRISPPEGEVKKSCPNMFVLKVTNKPWKSPIM